MGWTRRGGTLYELMAAGMYRTEVSFPGWWIGFVASFESKKISSLNYVT